MSEYQGTQFGEAFLEKEKKKKDEIFLTLESPE